RQSTVRQDVRHGWWGRGGIPSRRLRPAGKDRLPRNRENTPRRTTQLPAERGNAPSCSHLKPVDPKRFFPDVGNNTPWAEKARDHTDTSFTFQFRRDGRKSECACLR